jgi:predicted HTH domain antitoxin
VVEELVTISVRVRRDQAEAIEALALERGVDRSAAVRQLLAEAIREARLDRALDLLRRRKVSVWKAAEAAGITYREMLDELRTRNVPFPLSQGELKREFEGILRRQ